MTIWEKAVVNMQKGARKIAIAAATFSERVEAELAIVRLRIRVQEVQSRIDELHRIIGRKVEMFRNSEAMPDETERLLADQDIDGALKELGELKKELEELKQEIKGQQEAFKPVKIQKETPGI